MPTLAIASGAARAVARRLEPLSTDRVGVRFTADTEFKELLERVRGLASHRLPSGDLLTLMKRGLVAYERELEKERFAIGRRPERSNATTRERTEPRSRHVPAAISREVYTRDQGQCAFLSKNGRRCSAQAFLELDHREPFARGGEETTQNLRVLCRAHNQEQARQQFGPAYVRAVVARARSGRSTRPVADGCDQS
jgi:hypothetical protein